MYRPPHRKHVGYFILWLGTALVFCVFGTAAANQPDCVEPENRVGDIAHPKQDQQLNGLIRSYIDGTQLIPGLAVAVVENNQITFARGFGLRDLEACLPVDTRTGFYLKSTTKSYLGLAAAILHEEGQIRLDAPISEYLPELVPPGELNPDAVSLRSHFTHTHPYHDGGLNYRTAYPGNLPEHEWVAHINNWGTERGIEFRYSNVGPIIGALAISSHTGEHWRAMIEQRIFTPLGMTSSTTDIALAEAGNYGRSYLPDGHGGFEPTATKAQSQMHAAGGAVSSVLDLARFVIANLNGGQVDGIQAVPRRAVEHAQSRQVYLDWEILGARRFAHGLGLYSADYKGDVLVHHFGGETHMSFMPEHGIGVLVLTNAIRGGVHVTHRLALSIYDLMLGKDTLEQDKQAHISAINESVASRATQLAEAVSSMRESAPDGPRDLSLADIEGRYSDPRLGEMLFTISSQNLQVNYGALTGPLEHIGGDVYLAHFAPWGGPPERFEFKTDESGTLVMDWSGRVFVRKVH